MASLAYDGGADNAPTSRLGRLLRSRYVLGVGFALATILTAVTILLAASPPESGPLGPASSVILTLLGFDMVLILGLAAIVVIRFLALLAARTSDAGARLHLRFVTLFALAAVAPAVVVAFFYGVLVTRGVDNWFSERVQSVVEDSANIARTYVNAQQRYVQDHVPIMAQDLNNYAPTLRRDPAALTSFLEGLASYHAFHGAFVINGQGQIIASAEAKDAPDYQPPSQAAFKSANAGEIWLSSDLVRALYRLKAYPDAYLYVARPAEGEIIDHLRDSEASIVSYREAAQNRARIQLIFILSYFETALLVTVGAVWLGMAAANMVSAPVARLVQAAGKVAAGDLTARVETAKDPEEIAVLSRAFNRMTHDLQAQQAALRRAQTEAEARTQFIETVLSEVSAGVIGLDEQGRISAANRQAAVLLALPGDHGRGRDLSAVAPEFAAVAEQALESGAFEEEVDIVRGRDSRRLRVRASRSEGGLVLTFDDITRLVAAQRNAAWKDVARRIAHEIKNPLTPIQLSAERLRKKFRSSAPSEDLETFDRCTDTIVRQVGDIGRMVDEFSAFARMPAPKFTEQDLTELVRAGAFAQRVATPGIAVELEDPVPDVRVMADGRMLSQALTNVLKNASEAVAARRGEKAPGRIAVRLISDDEGVTVEVEDNGVGLPEKDRDRLTEPYVTTREKGTGLGLAIVKRILEDHGGELSLTDARSGAGALAILKLPAAARLKPAAATSAAVQG